MMKFRNIKKIIAFTLAMIMVMIPVSVQAISNTSVFVEHVYAMTAVEKDKFVDLFVLLQNVDDAQGLADAYENAFNALGGAQQDRIESFGATVDAVAAFADFIDDQSFSEANLRQYIGLNGGNVAANKLAFRNAIDARGAEFAAAFGGLIDTQLADGIEYMTRVFDLIEVFESSPFELEIFDATSVNGTLTINNSNFTFAINAANVILTDDISDIPAAKASFQQFVNYYNASSDKALIYAFFNSYNLIKLTTSGGGGGGGGSTVEPTGDPQTEVDNGAAVTLTAPVTNGVQQATVTSGNLSDALAKSLDALQSQQELLAEAGTVLDRELFQNVVLDIPAAPGATTVSATLPIADLKALETSGVDATIIRSSIGSVEFTMDSFLDPDQTATSMELTMKQVDSATIASVPAGAVVVDFSLKIDGVAVTSFNEPVKVSIPYVKKAGETSDEITVYFLQADGTTIAVGGVYNEATGMVEFTTNHFSKYFAAATKTQFIDVSSDYWANNYISVLAGKGVITGKGANKFDPLANITRAEFVAMVARSYNLVSNGKALPFTDVPSNAWYASEIKAAYNAGIIDGKTKTLFAPNTPITRQEAAVVISNTLKYLGYSLETNTTIIDSFFVDATSIATWAKKAVATAYKAKIIDGKPEKLFSPIGNATRAEVAKMIYQLYFLQ